MWILFARAPRPDAVVWPGRTLLAALDAVLWPALLAWTVLALPGPPGVLRPVLLALLALAARLRMQRALRSNHRYRFTTGWVVRWLAVLLLLGLAMKVLLH